MNASGELAKKRQRQARQAMYDAIHRSLSDSFFLDPEVRARLPQLEKDVLEGRMDPYGAARSLLALWGWPGA